MHILIEACHAKICIYGMHIYADSEGSDQTAHQRSLIWASAVRLYLYDDDDDDDDDDIVR